VTDVRLIKRAKSVQAKVYKTGGKAPGNISMGILTAVNNPKDFNSSPCPGTTLCAQFP